MDATTQDARDEEARRHVRALRGFYTHALVFVVVNLGLAAMHADSSPGRWGFGWGTAGWGIGLAFHALFVFTGWLGADWEERQVRRYLDRRRPGP
jgi:hypothetical protein